MHFIALMYYFLLLFFYVLFFNFTYEFFSNVFRRSGLLATNPSAFIGFVLLKDNFPETKKKKKKKTNNDNKKKILRLLLSFNLFYPVVIIVAWFLKKSPRGTELIPLATRSFLLVLLLRFHYLFVRVHSIHVAVRGRLAGNSSLLCQCRF